MLCNLNRAREQMRAAGVSALVATTYEGVLYLSDFDNGLPFFTGTRAAAILPAMEDAPATLIVAVPYLAHLVKAPTWMSDVRTFGSIGVAMAEAGVDGSPEADVVSLFDTVGSDPYPSLWAAIGATLDDTVEPGGVIGLDDPLASGMLPSPWSGSATMDARSLFTAIQIVKTPDEVALLREAARINEAAFDAAADAIQPGGRWMDATNAWRRVWADEGGTPMFWGGGAGSHASQFYPADTDYALSTGDVIRWEGGGVFRGYWADTGGSAVIGPATQRAQAMADALANGAEVARESIKPGARPEDICSSVLAAIRGSGIPDFPDSNAWGHGIGLKLNERPRVRPASGEVLEPGMVLCFETPYFELGWGGLQAEDTFVVTTSGCELLTHAPRTLQALAGRDA